MIILHDFHRSSACYRVRIALNIKGLAYERRVVDFRQHDQSGEAYLDINPQGLVPALEIDGRIITQSLAIIEYLDETRSGPRFLPDDPVARAEIRSLALMIACDIHPLNNLRVLQRLKRSHNSREDQINEWYAHWIRLGLAPLENRISALGANPYPGKEPGLFEICLVPQLYNARRYDIDLSPYPALLRIDSAARELGSFVNAAPEQFAPGE